MDQYWAVVKQTLHNAKAMHYDGCHKIYLSMDDGQVAEMVSYGYDVIEPDFDTLKEWYDDSCPLKLVDAVYTHPTNPNDGFVQLIPQGAEDDDEYDD